MSEEKKNQPFVNTFFIKLYYFFLILFFLEQSTRENVTIALQTKCVKKPNKKIQLYVEKRWLNPILHTNIAFIFFIQVKYVR